MANKPPPILCTRCGEPYSSYGHQCKIVKEQATDIETQVCADIQARQEKGLAKYGVSVADNPLPLKDWLQHAYEETLDKAIYLKRAISEIEAQEKRMESALKSIIAHDGPGFPHGTCAKIASEALAS